MLYEVDIIGAETGASMPALAFDFPLFRFQEAPLQSAHSLESSLEVRPIPFGRPPQSDLQQPVLPGFRGGFPDYLAWRMMSSLTLKFRQPGSRKQPHPTRFPATTALGPWIAR
jgi:hypothetical protein